MSGRLEVCRDDFMKNTLEKLVAFASMAHGSQKRKYSDEPYIVHPVRVMQLCSQHTQELPVLAAAVLHDVLEDTGVNEEQLAEFLHRQLEPGIARKTLELVIELTDIYTKKDYPQWNRRKRRAKEAVRLAASSPECQTIKYADIIDNVPEISAADPDFAPRYLDECAMLLEKMKDGDPVLYRAAVDTVQAEKERTKIPGRNV